MKDMQNYIVRRILEVRYMKWLLIINVFDEYIGFHIYDDDNM